MTPQELIVRVPDLPAPSPSIARLLALLSRPDSDNEHLLQIISQDGVLCAKLLALCNTAAYGLSTPVGSLDQAVMYLGHSEIHRLVMAVSFGGALTPELKGYAIGECELWRHSLMTAHLAVAIAAKAPSLSLDPSIAYTAGLIHDIGKLVISYALDVGARAVVLELVERRNSSLIAAEREVLGTDHAEVGACLLRQWKLPEILVEAVGNHHQPVSIPEPKLSAVVHVADLIALEGGCATGMGSYAKFADAVAIAALGFSDEDLAQLLLSAYDAVEEVDSLLTVC